jgi:hypothetical protein
MSPKKATARKKSPSGNRKTRKLVKIDKTDKSGKKDVKKCENTKCKLWLEQAAKNVAIFKKNVEKMYNTKLEEEKKVCGPNSEKSEDCKKIKQGIEFSKNILDGFNNNKKVKEGKELELSICKKLYCNEGCKESIFEKGNPDVLPLSLIKKYKKSKAAIDYLKQERKKVFVKKTSVLKDDFYDGLKPSDIKRLQKEGAISGCVQKV